MEEKFFTSFAEALEMEAAQIKPQDTFRDYENYSSLTELSVLAMLDSEFGIEIEMKEFNNYLTVGDLVQLVAVRSAK
jgi:acyl carrier protein